MKSKRPSDQLIESIDEIIETAEATQGPAYADMLTMALHVSQLTRVMGILAMMGEEAGVSHHNMRELRNASLMLSFSIMKQHADSIEFGDDWKDVLKQAEHIMRRIEAEERKSGGEQA